ncbi:LytR/AlgR family response regulator transcription factor [Arsenicibacter rosenii]|uniref:DNA-binding response regulator n=1 Tax=Arsenicibacter rosenii TaxID=1750698 RepID=A0A1S2VGT9_9BACT|nr:LytTR family DNA-binding domain-containing protein [Arsenicibacter rosenii]OIN57981.1 DNA-binding response regulator [Arsenicibacter rosenii]
MNVFLIEDEELAVRKLSKLLQEVAPDIQIVGTAASVRASVAWLDSNTAPDLILMDIELADGQSFEIFEQTTVSSPVIFTTSYDEYALKAFKVNSIDYLLKPIKRHELEASLSKYQRLHQGTDLNLPSTKNDTDSAAAIDALVQQLRQQIQPTDFRRRFLVKHRQQWIPIEVNDIAFFYTEEGISFFRTTTNQKYAVDYTLDELEKMLDPDQFFRANRQFITHIQSVQQIHPYFNNKLKLILKPVTDEEVVISREKATDFKKWMGK